MCKPGVFSICSESQALPPTETRELKNHPFVRWFQMPNNQRQRKRQKTVYKRASFTLLETGQFELNDL